MGMRSLGWGDVEVSEAPNRLVAGCKEVGGEGGGELEGMEERGGSIRPNRKRPPKGGHLEVGNATTLTLEALSKVSPDRWRRLVIVGEGDAEGGDLLDHLKAMDGGGGDHVFNPVSNGQELCLAEVEVLVGGEGKNVHGFLEGCDDVRVEGLEDNVAIVSIVPGPHFLQAHRHLDANSVALAEPTVQSPRDEEVTAT